MAKEILSATSQRRWRRIATGSGVLVLTVESHRRDSGYLLLLARELQFSSPGGETMNINSMRYLATGLFGLMLVTAGCAARTGNISGEADVRQGDSTSATGSGQTNTQSQSERSKTKSSAGSASGSAAQPAVVALPALAAEVQLAVVQLAAQGINSGTS